MGLVCSPQDRRFHTKTAFGVTSCATRQQLFLLVEVGTITPCSVKIVNDGGGLPVFFFSSKIVIQLGYITDMIMHLVP